MKSSSAGATGRGDEKEPPATNADVDYKCYHFTTIIIIIIIIIVLFTIVVIIMFTPDVAGARGRSCEDRPGETPSDMFR